MKKFLLILLALLFIFSACSSQNNCEPETGENFAFTKPTEEDRPTMGRKIRRNLTAAEIAQAELEAAERLARQQAAESLPTTPEASGNSPEQDINSIIAMLAELDNADRLMRQATAAFLVFRLTGNTTQINNVAESALESLVAAGHITTQEAATTRAMLAEMDAAEMADLFAQHSNLRN